MRAHGNGTAEVCAHNLLRIVRGEVAYVRTKGLATQYIDQPAMQVSPLAVADAKKQLEIFEPRINVDSYDVLTAMGDQGDFENDINLSRKEA